MISDGGARVQNESEIFQNNQYQYQFYYTKPPKHGAGRTPSSLPSSAPAYIDILGSERGASGIRNDG